MGKGRIVSGGEDGLYTVELLHNRERIEAEIAQLTQLIAELDAELIELETERNALVAERDAITAQIDATIAAAVAEGETPDVEALLNELAQASAAVQAQDVRIALVQGRRLEAVKRKEALDAVPTDPVQSAWCADFTEDLSGELRRACHLQRRPRWANVPPRRPGRVSSLLQRCTPPGRAEMDATVPHRDADKRGHRHRHL